MAAAAAPFLRRTIGSTVACTSTTQQLWQKLNNLYVLIRNSSKEVKEEGEKRLAILIIIRQLHAIVRIFYSLATTKGFPDFANPILERRSTVLLLLLRHAQATPPGF